MTKQFDYVVIGAGSAGSVLAARLTEDPNCSVLLLEAGGEDNYRWIHIPLGLGRLMQDPRYMWMYSTEPEPQMNGQQVYWPRGKVLGGSSSVNGMVYVRGSAYDYDQWRDTGCTGWGFDDVLPALKRMEHRAGGDPEYRGTDGPIAVTDIRHRDALTEGFYDACVESGIPVTDDYNAAQYEGVSYLQLSTTAKASRCSTAVGYLRKARGRSNLEIRTHVQVQHLLFTGNRVSGVAYRPTDAGDGPSSPLTEVLAGAEVIVCAGAINSPHILELSGIGDTKVLEQAGINPHQHLPGVGANLIDHLQVRSTYECSRPITLNDVLRNPFRGARTAVQYALFRRGLMATPTVSVHALARSSTELQEPDVKIQLAHISGADRLSLNKGLGVDPFPGFNIGSFQLRPTSRGTVHASCADAAVPPKIHANYLSTPDDVAATLRGLKMCRDVAAQPALSDLIVREVRPGPEVEDDESLLEYVRASGQTSFHPVGTCKMGTDSMAVVDAKLKVHGVVGLRVADASVIPVMVSSNTNAPSIMIGERCAEFIKEERRALTA
ncbi:MAG: GMC family oxidoreductase [Hyphomicrobiaceae bacterium]